MTYLFKPLSLSSNTRVLVRITPTFGKKPVPFSSMTADNNAFSSQMKDSYPATQAKLVSPPCDLAVRISTAFLGSGVGALAAVAVRCLLGRRLRVRSGSSALKSSSSI